jgi:ribonuclease HII
MLSSCYNPEFNYEIGVDEAGRGPMFGRLYVAGAVLPKDDSFHHDWMKDSKKFHSKKKIKTVSDYIKENAISYSIQYIEHDIIDQINIRQSVHKGMHESIREIFTKSNVKRDNTFLLIDGNDFKPYTFYDEDREEICALPHETIEGGDNKYTAIAAASILAKVARDEYIYTLCEEYPQLVERYGLGKNKGYGTKQHLDGIREFGITQWHRKTYGLCKNAKMNTV